MVSDSEKDKGKLRGSEFSLPSQSASLAQGSLPLQPEAWGSLPSKIFLAAKASKLIFRLAYNGATPKQHTRAFLKDFEILVLGVTWVGLIKCTEKAPKWVHRSNLHHSSALDAMDTKLWGSSPLDIRWIIQQTE